ncbi:MAG: uroporphyrinogen-III C-methyltransferase [Pseudomonadota bacterium]|nr:uroporphyrinogen-III C-methyltransferase [Pseudomonadota bacterium]MDE3036925.1 uroporphyrinogen-III C-methyltransferase [Pseudomonadota bacterium]
MTAKVSLVGAGPGDAELLTLKALKAIERADAVVYDRLVSEDVLALIPRGVARFFAGKSCTQKAMTQEEINDLLVALARQGKQVVRLKGGDPFLFGRGGEEAQHLAKHHIDFKIIPGITSAQGCAATAGIPLTHRGLATGVRFITGHIQSCGEPKAKNAGSHAADRDPVQPLPVSQDLQLDWQSLADADTTLVVYMGLANLGIIAEKLVEHGLDKHMPAAAIQDGTTDKQRVILSTLCDISQAVQDAKLEPPTLVIIGKVAALALNPAAQETRTPDIIQRNLPCAAASQPAG